MNPVIEAHFADIEARLIGSPAVRRYQITRRDIGFADGKFRVRLELSDSSAAELFEYVVESSQSIQVHKYSFHWQDSQGNLRRRWDNAPHYPKLSDFPHHIHEADGTVIPNRTKDPDIFATLAWIEQELES